MTAKYRKNKPHHPAESGDADDRSVWRSWRYACGGAGATQRSKEDDRGREITGQGKGTRQEACEECRDVRRMGRKMVARLSDG